MKKRDAKVRKLRSSSVFKDPTFPLACMRIKEHGNTAVHGHSFHELVIILAGQGHHVLDGAVYPLSPGDVFVIRGEMQHGYTGSEHVTLVNILYNPRQIGLPLNELRDLPGYHALFRVQPRLRPGERFKSRLRLSEEELTETAGMIYRLEQELQHERPGYRFLAVAQLMNLIGFLSRCYSRAGSPAERPLLAMGEVLSHIEQHIREPITVRDLTRVAHMSESTLIRTFRRVLGRSPLEHVIRARIARASELLRKSDVRVTEAAFECGFNDSNYFARQFRKITGMSPRRFRQLSRV